MKSSVVEVAVVSGSSSRSQPVVVAVPVDVVADAVVVESSRTSGLDGHV